MSEGPKICERGGKGLILPLFGDSEHEWPQALRTILYLFGLFWCFMGVAIIAEVFMAGIEKVTSKKVRMFDKKKQRFYTFEVWNATVANLTLMALGSSAPEILLNVIDIFAKEFYLEGLGPGTIVGSAAFNMLMIIAVCIIAIPTGEVRMIKDMPVYVTTAVWSVFAYFWLIVILVFISPNVVEVWEGVLTFLFFPMLTFHAFACDKGWIVKKDVSGKVFVNEDMTAEELAAAEEQVRDEHGRDLSAEQVARILAVMNPMKKTRAQYRRGAMAAMTGGKRRKKDDEDHKRSFSLRNLSFLKRSMRVVPIEVLQDPPVLGFEFKADKYAVLESAGDAVLKVTRTGEPQHACRVWYTTSDGTATAPGDYVSVEGWLEFKAGETEAQINVAVVDDDTFEPDEEFYVTLSKPQVLLASGESDTDRRAELGKSSRCTIVIIDDDDPGMLTFELEEMTVYQKSTDYQVPISVKRKNGGCGKVSALFVVEGDSAIAGRDFVACSGILEFEDHQMESKIIVTIKAVPRYDTKDRFRVIVSDPEGGVSLDEKRDGGKERNILTVMIEADPESKQRVDRVASLLRQKWDKSKIGHANWGAQFKEALQVNGGNDDDDDEPSPPSKKDYFAHVVSLPWKLLFALVPPTDYCGGWACLCCALLMIGFVTMIIGDMASLLGCTLCLPDDITAITFVALGTSLPDTFASKTAAEQDPYADASVGNVTGSNSVNVFLGLGLPWMIASIFWATTGDNAEWHTKYDSMEGLDFLGPLGSARTQGFVAEAGSLSFSVAVFATCATLSIIVLYVRRKLCGGELGGPTRPRWASFCFLLFLWFLYIGLSSWQSLSEKGGMQCPKV